MNPTLRLEHIQKTYREAPHAPPHEVLQDISLAVHPGDTIAIMGPSGSGKSTLLNIAGTLDAPTAGTVRLAGRDLSDTPPDALAEIRNRDIGFIFQLHHLLPQCTVLENVLLPTLPRRAKQSKPDRQVTRSHAETLLERVGLRDQQHQRPVTLSGGERQRVAVVRALINRPKLVLADEPTGALDNETAAPLMDLLVELNQETQLALIVVTHAEHIAARMQQRFHLRNGHLDPAS